MLTPSPSLPLTPNDHHYKSISCREGFTDIDQEYVKINIMFEVYNIFLMRFDSLLFFSVALILIVIKETFDAIFKVA